MSVASLHWRPRPLAAAAAALGLAAGLAACSLDKVDKPPLSGPSETGISVQLTAVPDVVNADGVSQAVVRLVLRDPNGLPVAGLAVLFDGLGDGTLLPSPGSTYVGPVQTGLVMATDRDGVANVIYVAGKSPGTTVTIRARPYSIDSLHNFFRTVEILLR
jgi:hypothetical protein